MIKITQHNKVPKWVWVETNQFVRIYDLKNCNKYPKITLFIHILNWHLRDKPNFPIWRVND